MYEKTAGKVEPKTCKNTFSAADIEEMKDYYLLLGVNKKADKSEIKKAYRDSAKKCHPDGSEASKDTKRFRDITEAYETLSDNIKRKKYDEALVNSIPLDSPGSVESIKPCFKSHQRRYDPNPFIRDYADDIPLKFFRRDNPAQHRLNCVINLTHEEIQNDVHYPYEINIVKPCPHCNSFFSDFILFCPYCHGSQYLITKKELIINIPKGTDNGSCVYLDLDHVGLSEVKLVVKVFIAPNWE